MIIEKGIPIPRKAYKATGRGDEMRAKLAEMEVGDSFLATGQKEYKALFDVASRAGMNICQRQTAEGMRVWRTK